MEVQVVKKMNLKAIGCDAKDAIRQNAQVFMARIGGVVQDVKTKEGKNGEPYSYFVGQFLAQRPDGSEYASDVLFLPGFMHEKIEAEFATAGGKPVEFGFDIFSSPSDKATIGYSYSAQSLVKTAATDRVAELKAQFATKPLPGIPAAAPTPAPLPAPVSEPADKSKTTTKKAS